MVDPCRLISSPNQMHFETPGQDTKTLQDIVNDERTHKPTATEFDVRLPEGTVVKMPGFPIYPLNGQRVSGVSFKIRQLPTVEERLVIRGEDHVHWIMLDVFEGTRRTIRADGTITRIQTEGVDDDK